jgi:Ribosomal protein L7/L12 dimerisation domain
MADINSLVEKLSELTVLEAADLAKALEEKWGVSAAAAVAAAPAGGGGAAAPAEEEKTEFDVILAGRERSQGDQGRHSEGRGRGAAQAARGSRRDRRGQVSRSSFGWTTQKGGSSRSRPFSCLARTFQKALRLILLGSSLPEGSMNSSSSTPYLLYGIIALVLGVGVLIAIFLATRRRP